MARRDVTRDHLAEATYAALGSGRQLEGVARLAGGTTKGVYRLTLDDGSTVIAYLWAESENFWPQTAHDGDFADQFSSGNSMDLFVASHHRLASLGLRVPEIYLLDRDRCASLTMITTARLRGRQAPALPNCAVFRSSARIGVQRSPRHACEHCQRHTARRYGATSRTVSANRHTVACHVLHGLQNPDGADGGRLTRASCRHQSQHVHNTDDHKPRPARYPPRIRHLDPAAMAGITPAALPVIVVGGAYALIDISNS